MNIMTVMFIALFGLACIVAYVAIHIVHMKRDIGRFMDVVYTNLDHMDNKLWFIYNISIYSTPVVRAILCSMQEQAIQAENYEYADKLKGLIVCMDLFCKSEDEDAKKSESMNE